MGELPKIHPTHHRGTMLGLMLLIALLILLGIAAEKMAPLPPWVMPVLAIGWLISFVGWVLLRVKRARCPQCSRPMKHLRSVEQDKQQMEVFGCAACGKEWTVPGVTSE